MDAYDPQKSQFSNMPFQTTRQDAGPVKTQDMMQTMGLPSISQSVTATQNVSQMGTIKTKPKSNAI